jgi:hypothetical protein
MLADRHRLAHVVTRARGAGVQDPRVVEDQAIARCEPQVQLAFRPGQ